MKERTNEWTTARPTYYLYLFLLLDMILVTVLLSWMKMRGWGGETISTLRIRQFNFIINLFICLFVIPPHPHYKL